MYNCLRRSTKDTRQEKERKGMGQIVRKVF